jgi:hypothetical protein
VRAFFPQHMRTHALNSGQSVENTTTCAHPPQGILQAQYLVDSALVTAPSHAMHTIDYSSHFWGLSRSSSCIPRQYVSQHSSLGQSNHDLRQMTSIDR